MNMTPKKVPRLSSLDCLRGIAAVLVMWFHFAYANNNLTHSPLLKASGKYGHLGVEIFFVISGFILPYSLYKANFSVKKHWKNFLAKRFFRIEPPYLAALLLTLTINIFVPLITGKNQVPNYSLAQILSHIDYLTAILDYEWVNLVFWTLAIEFQFYLLLILIYPLLKRFPFLSLCALLAVSLTSSSFYYTLACRFRLRHHSLLV
jgi:peptidoglycan/LPS O-acetylase OafA/YrhL